MFNVKLVALKASSSVFGNEIPDNWFDLSSEDQLNWYSENVSADFEDMTPNALKDLIECHAEHSLMATYKELLNHLKEKLIQGAIEGTLPDDYNNLDLATMIGLEQ